MSQIKTNTELGLANASRKNGLSDGQFSIATLDVGGGDTKIKSVTSSYWIDSNDGTLYYSGSKQLNGSNTNHGNHPIIDAMDIEWAPYEINGKKLRTTADLINEVNELIYITVKTDDSTQNKNITIEELLTWLVITKKYIPNNCFCSKKFRVSWSYAGNDNLLINPSDADTAKKYMGLEGSTIEFNGQVIVTDNKISFANDNGTNFEMKFTFAPTENSDPSNKRSIWIYRNNSNNYIPGFDRVIGRQYSISKIDGEIFNNYESNIASGVYSHAEGNVTKATGEAAHAGGKYTNSTGEASFANGFCVNSYNNYETSFGKFNKSTEKSNQLFSIGNGTSVDKRHNIVEVIGNGNTYINSNIYPDTNNTYNIGQSQYKYNVVYTSAIADGTYPPIVLDTILTSSRLNPKISVSQIKPIIKLSEYSNNVPKAGNITNSNRVITSINVSYITNGSNPGLCISYEWAESIGARYFTGNNSVGGEIFNSSGEGVVNVNEASGSLSHAEGQITHATAIASHAEGKSTHATGEATHAEGYNTYAQGIYSHAEGGGTTWTGIMEVIGLSQSNADIIQNKYGISATHFAKYTYTDINLLGATLTCNGKSSLINNVKIVNTASLGLTNVNNYTDIVVFTTDNKDNVYNGANHTVTKYSRARGSYTHTEGYLNMAFGNYGSHAEGNNTAAQGSSSHSEGKLTNALATASHSEGTYTGAFGTASHSEGDGTVAFGSASHAEGYKTIALGNHSHAEGNATKAAGLYSHAEGVGTESLGERSHAEGTDTQATGNYSHAEGNRTKTTSEGAHAEGYQTKANSRYSHAEGYQTEAGRNENAATMFINHAEGYKTTASGAYGCHAEGGNTKAGGGGLIYGAHAEGYADTNGNIHAKGTGSHAEGWARTIDEEAGKIEASGNGSHAEGCAEGANITASGTGSHAEGYAEGANITASGTGSHAEGMNTSAFKEASHAEGNETTSNGFGAHAEGNLSTSNGFGAHAEGHNTAATGDAAHAEGHNTAATGRYSHSEGTNTTASGIDSHAEGLGTRSSGERSHAEGIDALASGKCSHAEGIDTIASAKYSHSEGNNTKTTGEASHAEGKTSNNSNYYAGGIASHIEGYNTKTTANYSHAEGNTTIVTGDASHAEGSGTKANSKYSHAEGYNTEAGRNENTSAIFINHAEGYQTVASGAYGCHAEGGNTKAGGGTGIYGAHAEGYAYTKGNIYANGVGAHAEGYAKSTYQILSSAHGSHAEGYAKNKNLTASGAGSHAEGVSTTASNEGAHAEGYNTTASATYSHAEGNSTTASATNSHAEGSTTTASNTASHAEGYSTTASATYSHAEGNSTTASGTSSHAEGYGGTSFSEASHVEGYETKSDSLAAHAEGYNTKASGEAAHAEGKSDATSTYYAGGIASHTEGYNTKTTADYSHAEGNTTIASNESAHAEGQSTTASGARAHAEGYSTKAIGSSSHAEGQSTTASGNYSHAGGLSSSTNSKTGAFVHGNGIKVNNNYEVGFGQFNDYTTKQNQIFSVGIGTSDANRKNAFAIYNQSGNSIVNINNTNTKPAIIANDSTITCTNLNADKLDGYHISIEDGSHTTNANNNTIYFVTGVDATPGSSGSGGVSSDADTVDGLHAIKTEHWQKLASIDNYGAVELGKSIKFYTESTSSTYAVLLSAAQGSTQSNGTLTLTGNLNVTGNAYNTSDIRLKNIKEDINVNIEDIAKLPLFKFTWNNINDNNIHIGTSAQAVEEIIPELVSENEYKSLNYANLGVISGVLAAREITKLIEENNNLRNELNDLKNILKEKGLM